MNPGRKDIQNNSILTPKSDRGCWLSSSILVETFFFPSGFLQVLVISIIIFSGKYRG